MKRVFLAEKPSLGRAIASVLGNGKKEDGYIQIGNDVVTWCFGHICNNAIQKNTMKNIAVGSWKIFRLFQNSGR